jgi:hypothetical protein
LVAVVVQLIVTEIKTVKQVDQVAAERSGLADTMEEFLYKATLVGLHLFMDLEVDVEMFLLLHKLVAAAELAALDHQQKTQMDLVMAV